MSNTVKIHDRVKETSTSTGQGNFGLLGAVAGFTSFGDAFDHLDTVFYAIADRTNYEIGSGILYKAGGDLPNGGTVSYSYITRSPFSSSNLNGLVNFTTGTKEIFATYPATHAVYSGSGLADFSVPSQHSVAFWNSANMINSDSDFIWNQDFKSLGLQNNTPVYGIDIGGDGSQQSAVRASGYYVGISGVTFRATNGDDSSYVGGIQYKHFLPNQTDNNSKSSLVIEHSGVVNEYTLLKKQTVNYVFAAPTGVCDGACPEDYPSFRQLYATDIPDLSHQYATLTKLAVASGDLIGIMDAKDAVVADELDTKYVALSGYLIDWNRDNNERIVSHFIAESGRADQFFINHSGRLDTQFNTFSGIFDNKFNTLDSKFNVLDNNFQALENQFDTFSGVFDNKFEVTDNKVDTFSGVFDNKVQVLNNQFDNFVEDHTPVYFSAVGSGNSLAMNSSRQYSSFSTFNFDIVESNSHPASFNTNTYIYSAPKSGVYTISTNIVASGGELLSPLAEFRLVTSGNQVLTTGNMQYIGATDFPTSAGKVWHVPLASGDKAYIEASGNFLDSSTISIHRI